jgi:hypothetical protein
MWALALAAGLFLWLGLPGVAHAYLDPGTGSAVIQMLVAGVMGALFLLKVYWRKLASLFGGTSQEDESPPAQRTVRDESDGQ